MKIGIACGGTGGHIFPGLATANVLRARGHELSLWLVGQDRKQAALVDWNGPIVSIDFSWPARLFSWRILGMLGSLSRVIWLCRRRMLNQGLEVLLAMGSYASLGPVLAARSLGIAVVLHEANVVPGRAIRWLSRSAAAVGLGFQETRQYLRHPRLVVTGMPLRCDAPAPPAALAPAGADLWRQLEADSFTLLVMGGSHGARRLNEFAPPAIRRVRQAGHRLQVIHLTGLADEQSVRQQYQQAGVPHVVFGFLRDMASAYRRADLALSRAGASSCAELAHYGIAALLVPYPFAVHQHQLANAGALQAAGAADVRREAEMSVAWLAEYLIEQIKNPARLQGMRQAALRRQRAGAAAALADLVETIGSRQDL